MSERPATIDSVPLRDYVPTADHRIVLSGLSWSDFESFIALRGEDASGPRVTYLEGTLQLMSPSYDHETIRRIFAAVVEAYLEYLRIPHHGVGSWLVRRKPQEAGLEPDDCYILHDRDKDRPDLALEVVWTSGGIDKLEVYQRIGVPEVWFWDDGVTTFYILGERGYEPAPASLFIPSFDKQLVNEMIALKYLDDVKAALRKRFA